MLKLKVLWILVLTLILKENKQIKKSTKDQIVLMKKLYLKHKIKNNFLVLPIKN